MNPNREEVLFELALEQPASQRDAFLNAICGNDKALRARIKDLITAHEQSEGVLAESAPTAKGTMRVEPADVPDETVGQKIGRYKILEKIGEGGCGVVYVAEQTEPVRRRVALKVIKLGMDTKQVVARFEAERQALALMDHPNIAKVLDAGTTETGRPYFIMELVRGIRITDYCDQNKLSTKERLELFIRICHAIQHAHQKGIIHRDIKPSNILVTLHDGVPVPKVIDFGIAKATTDQRLTDKTIYTQLQQFIGTPAYMSPEQAEMSGLDIDTRSDIYSLGVLLYELLTGKTPFDGQELMSQGIDAMRKTIREKEPVKPSTKLQTLQGEDLTTTAKRHGAEVPKLVSQLCGDLDWIVMRCLEKDRTRRYETANGLAMDLKRHLNNETVVARPPSKLYELQKAFRRHKVGFAATAAIVVVLAAGVLVSTWQAVRAKAAERKAVSAEARATGERQKAEANERKAVEAQASEAKQKASAQQELYKSLLGQAQATRFARQLGYRDRDFDLLEQAKALDVPQKSLADLRNEAAACLGDFAGLTPVTFANFRTNILSACLAPSGKLAAFELSDGTIQLMEMPSGIEVAHFDNGSTNGMFIQLCFNTTGDQLFAIYWPKAKNLTETLQFVPRHRLYTWACEPDGHWQETGDRTLPGAYDLSNNGAEVFATIVNVGPVNSVGSEKNHSLSFRRFDVTTDAVVAGYEVTDMEANVTHWDAAETADGRLLAVETEDLQSSNTSSVLKLYDWKTGRQINRLRLPSQAAISLSPDGEYLSGLSYAAGGAIYRVPTLECIAQFKESFSISFDTPAVFSRGMVALPIYQQNRIRLWNLATRENIALLDESEMTAPMAFSADGDSLLTIGDHHARLYRLNTPERVDLPGHPAAVPGIAFSPDGKQLASVSKDHVLQVCEATTGQILWQTKKLPGAGQCVSYSPDGQWLATGDYETALVQIRDAHTGQLRFQVGTNATGKTWSAQFSPDGRCLATAGSGGIRIYKIEVSEGSMKATLLKSNSLGGWNLLFAPNGQSLEFEYYHNNPSLSWWDFDKSPEPSKLGFVPPVMVEMESFTPDGHLVALDRKGKVVTLDLPSGKEISSFQARKPSNSISDGICLSPDGVRLAVTSESQRGVDIWEFKTGKRLYSLPDEAGAVYWLAWSPDSRRLAIARDNGNVAIWRIDTVGQILTKLGLNP